jgi:hypothetical protein
VRAELVFPNFVPSTARVIHTVVPPRFSHATALEVTGQDSDDNVLVTYTRSDARFQRIEGQASRAVPDGTPFLFNIEVVPALRRVRVVDTAGTLLMDFDLGPTLVAACSAGELPAGLCATLDSDGDGCRDAVDSDPLVPEDEPPQLAGSISPTVLWPPSHRLVNVAATLTATDNCTATPTVVLWDVQSSEPQEGVTAADLPPRFAPDILGADVGTFDLAMQLRAERWAHQRTYTVIYRATDRVGNATFKSLLVRVPRSLGAVP